MESTVVTAQIPFILNGQLEIQDHFLLHNIISCKYCSSSTHRHMQEPSWESKAPQERTACKRFILTVINLKSVHPLTQCTV